MFPLLEIKNLHIDFITETGQTTAVRDITFTVNRNEIVGIAGESGSGKSVTSMAILKLLSEKTARYVSGEINFSPDGHERIDLLRCSGHEMQRIRGGRIAMIFQEPMTSLNPVFTCGEQVMEAVQLHRRLPPAEAKKAVIDLFTRVKLPNPQEMFSRYPHQLSGGQKQRVMIAMAMSGNPALLICDEPTTALDVTVQKTILELIRELQEQTGMGVIFISHDLAVISEIAARVVVMYRGSIVEQASAKTLFSSPGNAYTKALLACRPALYQKGQRLPVVGDFVAGNTSAPTRNIDQPATTSSDIQELIRVSELSVWFPAKRTFFGKAVSFTRAVDRVSFSIFRGETLGLVGESGCGKTTLGRTLLRLIPPTSGTISYEGTDLAAMAPAQLRRFRKHMQIIFQDPYSSLNPSITAGDAITEPMQVHHTSLNARQRKDKAVQMLEKVGLTADHFNRYPHEFSGGQRQRIVIARALVLEPEFIICDESVSALDVSVQAQVLNLLNDLKQEFGFTSVFISHDLSVVRYVSDRIMVMNKGRIEETGTPEQIYSDPRSPYTRKLVEAMPVLQLHGNG